MRRLGNWRAKPSRPSSMGAEIHSQNDPKTPSGGWRRPQRWERSRGGCRQALWPLTVLRILQNITDLSDWGSPKQTRACCPCSPVPVASQAADGRAVSGTSACKHLWSVANDDSDAVLDTSISLHIPPPATREISKLPISQGASPRRVRVGIAEPGARTDALPKLEAREALGLSFPDGRVVTPAAPDPKGWGWWSWQD